MADVRNHLRRLIVLASLICGLASPLGAQTQGTISPGVDAANTCALTAPGTCVVNTSGGGSASFTLTGTFTGLNSTIQGLVSGSATWVTLPEFQQSGSGTFSSPFIGNIGGAGTFAVAAGGFNQVRLNVTALSAGTLNIFAEAGAGQSVVYLGNVAVNAAGLIGVGGGGNTTVDGVAGNNNSGAALSQAENYIFNGATWDRERSLGSATGIAAVSQAPSANASVGIAPVSSSAIEGSHIFKGSGGNLYSLEVTTGASAGLVMIFNSATVPADGAVTPAYCKDIAASSTVDYAWPIPAVLGAGIVAVFSTGTACTTKTISATAFFVSQFQ